MNNEVVELQQTVDILRETIDRKNDEIEYLRRLVAWHSDVSKRSREDAETFVKQFVMGTRR